MKKIAFILALSISTIQFGCASTSTQGTWTSWPSTSQMTSEVQSAISDMESGKMQSADQHLTPELRASTPAAAILHAEIAALRGETQTAIDEYTAFIKAHPDNSLSTVALIRMRMLSASHAEFLNWEELSKLKLNTPFDMAQLIVLQNRAMRNAPNGFNLSHPTAIPLVRWRWMGPFTPYAFTGFQSDLPFDSDPLLAAQYEVDGKKLEQFRYTPENVTAMAAMLPGMYVAETTIKTEKNHDLQITVQGAQFYTIFIDGTPILTRDQHDYGQESILATTFTLKPGTHNVRIRLGLIPSSNTNRHIALWLSNANSKEHASLQDIQDVVELDEPASAFTPDDVKNIKRIDTTYVLGNSTTSVPDDTFRTWYASILAIAAGKTQVADELLRNRLANFPDDFPAKYLYVLRYRKDIDLDASVRHEKSMTLLRDISDNAPQIANAHQMLITEFVNQNQPKQALKIWENNKSHFPTNNAYTSLIFSQLTNALSWSEISNEFALLAASQAPKYCRLNLTALELLNQNHVYPSYSSLSEDLQACPQIIRYFEKLEGNDPSVQSDLRDKWFYEIQYLADKYPADASLQLEALNTLASTNPADAASKFIQLLTPLSYTYLLYSHLSSSKILSIIDKLRAAGYQDQADIILKKAMEFMPADDSLIYMDLHNQNARLFEDLRMDGIQIIKDYLAQNRNDPGNSVMILDYAATRINPDGSKIGLTHQISRVLTKEGKNSVGEIYLPQAASILKVRTIKDGSFEIIEPEAINYKDSITAPNLAVGDYVETEYLTFEPPSSATTSRTVTDLFFFGADMVPLVRSEYVVDYPKTWNVKIVQSGPENLIQLNCSPNGDFTRCIAKRENIPPFISENLSGSIIDLIPNIQFSFLYNWDFIRKALFETVSRQTRITPYIERFYEKIGVPETESVWERARFIYDFVMTSIDESEDATTENESATSSVTRGTGSRLLVLKSLYDFAGFSSYMALRRTLGAPINSEDLPALYNSTHELVLVVDTEKGPAYVQPEEDFMPFDYLDPTAQNQKVLPLNLSQTPFVSRTEDPEMTTSNIDIEYVLQNDGTASAKSIETTRGARAISMRNFLDMVKNDPDMAEQLIQNSLATSYGRVSLTHLSKENLDDRNQPFILKYNFDIAQFADISDNNLNILSRIFAYNLVNQHAAIPPSEKKFDTFVPDAKLSHRTLTFHAPDGYHWQTETLHDVNIDTPFGKYSRHTDTSGNELKLSESIQLLPQRVALSDYAAFRDFCHAVDEAQRSVISAIK